MADNQEEKKSTRRYVKINNVPAEKCGHDHSEDKEHCFYQGGPMSHELFSHLPFSVLSVTVGLIFAGLICFLVSDALVEKAGELVLKLMLVTIMVLVKLIPNVSTTTEIMKVTTTEIMKVTTTEIM